MQSRRLGSRYENVASGEANQGYLSPGRDAGGGLLDLNSGSCIRLELHGPGARDLGHAFREGHMERLAGDVGKANVTACFKLLVTFMAGKQLVRDDASQSKSMGDTSG